MDSFELSPVVQRSLSDEAAVRLRQAIRRGTLPPGARLVERELAARLGMSRIPIREAMQRLIDEGLVKKIPHRGTFVYTAEAGEIEEISSLRCVLERFVVERVVLRWQPEHEARLRRIVEEMRRHAATRDFEQMYVQDLEFHRVLWEIAEHSLLLEVVSGLRSRINRFLHEAAGAMPPDQLDTYIAKHSQLIGGLMSGDIAAAQEMITDHIIDSKERILAYYATARPPAAASDGASSEPLPPLAPNTEGQG
jgi:DNA-binding GntR family transcriptional regulator